MFFFIFWSFSSTCFSFCLVFVSIWLCVCVCLTISDCTCVVLFYPLLSAVEWRKRGSCHVSFNPRIDFLSHSRVYVSSLVSLLFLLHWFLFHRGVRISGAHATVRFEFRFLCFFFCWWGGVPIWRQTIHNVIGMFGSIQQQWCPQRKYEQSLWWQQLLLLNCVWLLVGVGLRSTWKSAHTRIRDHRLMMVLVLKVNRRGSFAPVWRIITTHTTNVCNCPLSVK